MSCSPEAPTRASAALHADPGGMGVMESDIPLVPPRGTDLPGDGMARPEVPAEGAPHSAAGKSDTHRVSDNDDDCPAAARTTNSLARSMTSTTSATTSRTPLQSSRPDGIGVVIRVRPLSTFERTNPGVKTVVKCLHSSIVVDPSSMRSAADCAYGTTGGAPRVRQFDVDEVFHPHSTQIEVYNRSCRHIIQGAFEGVNGAILAYGATGAGKTHSMFGSELSAVGIVFQAMQEIFQEKHRLEHEEGKRVTIRISFLEVYNEEVFDLLAPGGSGGSPPPSQAGRYPTPTSVTGKPARTGNTAAASSSGPRNMAPTRRQPLHVRDVGQDESAARIPVPATSRAGGLQVTGNAFAPCLTPEQADATARRAANPESLVVAGLSIATPRTVKEFAHVIGRGHMSRFVAATHANAHSSRSHAIITAEIDVRDSGNTSRGTIARIRFCDLAGSERAASTSNTGIRLREGGNINKSLLALGAVVQALAQKQNRPDTFVPFRGSKLTRLLRDCLGGNCRTQMLFCISPASSNYEETINTLLFAMQAKKVRSTVTRNEFVVSQKMVTKNQEALIEQLRAEIAMLKGVAQRPPESPDARAEPTSPPGVRPSDRCSQETAVMREQTQPPSPSPADMGAVANLDTVLSATLLNGNGTGSTGYSRLAEVCEAGGDPMENNLSVQSLNDKLAALMRSSTAAFPTSAAVLDAASGDAAPEIDTDGPAQRWKSHEETTTIESTGESKSAPGARRSQALVEVIDVPAVLSASVKGDAYATSSFKSLELNPLLETRGPAWEDRVPSSDRKTTPPRQKLRKSWSMGVKASAQMDGARTAHEHSLSSAAQVGNAKAAGKTSLSRLPPAEKRALQASAPAAVDDTMAPHLLDLRKRLLDICTEKEALYRQDKEAQERLQDLDLQMRQQHWKLAEVLSSTRDQYNRGKLDSALEKGSRRSAGAGAGGEGTAKPSEALHNGSEGSGGFLATSLQASLMQLRVESERLASAAPLRQEQLDAVQQSFQALNEELQKERHNSALELALNNAHLRQNCTEAECLAAHYHQECRTLLNKEGEYAQALSECVSAMRAALPHMQETCPARQRILKALLFATLPVAPTAEMIPSFEKAMSESFMTVPEVVVNTSSSTRKAHELKTVNPLQRHRPEEAARTQKPRPQSLPLPPPHHVESFAKDTPPLPPPASSESKLANAGATPWPLQTVAELRGTSESATNEAHCNSESPAGADMRSSGTRVASMSQSLENQRNRPERFLRAPSAHSEMQTAASATGAPTSVPAATPLSTPHEGSLSSSLHSGATSGAGRQGRPLRGEVGRVTFKERDSSESVERRKEGPGRHAIRAAGSEAVVRDGPRAGRSASCGDRPRQPSHTLQSDSSEKHSESISATRPLPKSLIARRHSFAGDALRPLKRQTAVSFESSLVAECPGRGITDTEGRVAGGGARARSLALSGRELERSWGDACALREGVQERAKSEAALLAGGGAATHHDREQEGSMRARARSIGGESRAASSQPRLQKTTQPRPRGKALSRKEAVPSTVSAPKKPVAASSPGGSFTNLSYSSAPLRGAEVGSAEAGRSSLALSHSELAHLSSTASPKRRSVVGVSVASQQPSNTEGVPARGPAPQGVARRGHTSGGKSIGEPFAMAQVGSHLASTSIDGKFASSINASTLHWSSPSLGASCATIWDRTFVQCASSPSFPAPERQPSDVQSRPVNGDAGEASKAQATTGLPKKKAGGKAADASPKSTKKGVKRK